MLNVSPQPFRKDHARQALAFQLCLFGVWLLLTVLTVAEAIPPAVLLVVLGLALLAELPQVFRALAGRPPLRLARS